MGCCETFAKIWMAIACLLFTLSGFALTGFSVYAHWFLKGHLQLSATNITELWILFGAGLALALLSITVWIATCHNENCCSKVILTLCATVALIFIIAIAAGSVVFILWTQNKAGDTVDNWFNGEIKDTVFPLCCNVTTNATKAKKQCDPAQALIDQNCPPVFCEPFEKSCNDEQDFANQFMEYVQKNLVWIGVVALLVGLLDLGSFITMCVLVCKRSREENYYTNYNSGPYV